jgi:Lon-like protease
MNMIKRFFKRKDYVIIASSLSFVIAVTMFIMWPQHKEFTAVGDIVSVEELGIDGSVYFTYVEGGMTSNRFEEMAVLLNYTDPSFIALTEEDVAYLEEYYMDDSYFDKEETIENAVEVATSGASHSDMTEELSNRIEEIMNYSEGYYGNSIGLMTAVGLVEELTNSDFSKGGKYVIAGTGTMEADETVWSVGAIREKLLTAEYNDVDFFLIPKDREYYEVEDESNEAEAERIKKEEHLTVHIVPVSSLEHAIQFLRNLP